MQAELTLHIHTYIHTRIHPEKSGDCALSFCYAAPASKLQFSSCVHFVATVAVAVVVAVVSVTAAVKESELQQFSAIAMKRGRCGDPACI